MRIGIDIRCLAEGKISGVEEYLINTLRQLFDSDKKNEYILFFNSFLGSRVNLQWLKKYPNVEIRDYRFPNKLLNLSLWLLKWPKIDWLLGTVHVFFAPNIGFLALSKDCKKILTIHDLSFERLPETFSFKRRLWHFMINARSLAKEFDTILAVSESTKQDIISLYGIPEQKILVSYPPLNIEQFEQDITASEIRALKERYGLKSKFILYLGTVEPRKNIISIIEAIDQLKMDRAYADVQLVIAGAKGWKYDEIYECYEKSQFRHDILFADFIRPEDKINVYRLAYIFVYPSFLEGFGFPPVEAMAAGTPVITSNCSSIPEVVGDAAVLIDPYRPYEITLALQQLLTDQDLYDEYVKRGKQRAKYLHDIERKKICNL